MSGGDCERTDGLLREKRKTEVQRFDLDNKNPLKRSHPLLLIRILDTVLFPKRIHAPSISLLS